MKNTEADNIVDICITTRMKKLERVCFLAEALAERRYSNRPTSILQLTVP